MRIKPASRWSTAVLLAAMAVLILTGTQCDVEHLDPGIVTPDLNRVPDGAFIGAYAVASTPVAVE